MTTEREQYLEHRIPVVEKMLRVMEKELREIRERKADAYLERLESCNPANAEALP